MNIFRKRNDEMLFTFSNDSSGRLCGAEHGRKCVTLGKLTLSLIQ